MGSRDLSSKNGRGNKNVWRWTNERHLDYLNSMEATFVQTMLNHLPLNRSLPDISDSTLDISDSTLDRRSPPARRFSTSDILDSTRNARSDKRTRRLPYHPYNTTTTSQDQVVPQYEGRRTSTTETDERGHQVDVTPPN